MNWSLLSVFLFIFTLTECAFVLTPHQVTADEVVGWCESMGLKLVEATDAKVQQELHEFTYTISGMV